MCVCVCVCVCVCKKRDESKYCRQQLLKNCIIALELGSFCVCESGWAGWVHLAT